MTDVAAELDAGAVGNRADALVVFGITGDLGRTKIIPALADLHHSGRLDGVQLVGVGRSERSPEEIATLVHESLDHPSGALPHGLADQLHYLSGDAADTSTFDHVAAQLDGAQQPVVYAAVPPAVVGDAARAIAASHMPATTRLVVEKPFGTDGDSARDLYREIAETVGTDRLFIVDHFLAKAAVENLLTVRTANALLDQVLHRRTVTSVRVEMLETEDVAGRGTFYDRVGVVDDVVQNHLLQLAALALMEPPDNDSDEAYHAARSAAIQSLSVDADSVVLGQYDGYADHRDVDDDTSTPTFCSFTMSSDTNRWRGVPIEMVGGKALHLDATSVTFHLGGRGNNIVRFDVKPEPTIALTLDVLAADAHDGLLEGSTRRSEATLCGPGTHGDLGDYATLLDDALDGTRQHFARIDDVTSAWDLVTALSGSHHAIRPYEPGSTGPT